MRPPTRELDRIMQSHVADVPRSWIPDPDQAGKLAASYHCLVLPSDMRKACLKSVDQTTLTPVPGQGYANGFSHWRTTLVARIHLLSTRAGLRGAFSSGGKRKLRLLYGGVADRCYRWLQLLVHAGCVWPIRVASPARSTLPSRWKGGQIWV